MNASFIFWNFRTLIAAGLAVIALIVFTATNPYFFTAGNLYALLQSFAVLVVVAVALGVVMLAGEFDISIAGTFPLAALVAVKLGDHLGVAGAVIGAAIVCAAFGALNGWLTAALRLPSLAVTVGSLVLAVGISFAIANGETAQMRNYQPGLALTQPLAGIFSLQSLMEMLVAAAVLVAIKYTWAGRYVYATGSSLDRASASRVPVRSTVVGAFILVGIAVGVGGGLQGVTLASAAAGENDAFLLQAATAAILGGVALTGGKGSLVGVVAAALLLATITNGLSLVGTNAATIQLVNGIILLVVVIIDRPLDRFATRSVRSMLTMAA